MDDQFLKLNKKENCLYGLYYYIDHPVLRAMIQGVDIAKQLSGFLFISTVKKTSHLLYITKSLTPIARLAVVLTALLT